MSELDARFSWESWIADLGGGGSQRPAPGKRTLTDRMAPRPAGVGLPAALRGRFEESLGTDLGDVRVHGGGDAARAAAAIDARAFAFGHDIVLGDGDFDPGRADDALLLAHEVAHTVQQRGAAPETQAKLEVSQEGDAHEDEADAAAMAMVRGLPARVSAAGGVARKVMRWTRVRGFTGEYEDTEVLATARFFVNGEDRWNNRPIPRAAPPCI